LTTALIHLDPKQKQRLARRAKQRGRSFSQEVRNAVDLYLSIPVKTEEELEVLARAANESAGRMIKRLDETIAHVDKTLGKCRKAHR
jgi:predicted DNA-binding protein